MFSNLMRFSSSMIIASLGASQPQGQATITGILRKPLDNESTKKFLLIVQRLDAKIQRLNTKVIKQNGNLDDLKQMQRTYEESNQQFCG